MVQTALAVIAKGVTTAADPMQALDEFAGQMGGVETALVVAFCAPAHARAPGFAAALQGRFGEVPVIGCTTAGEIGRNGHQQGGLAGFALPAQDFQVATALIEGVRCLQPETLKREVRRLEDQLLQRGGTLAAGRAFAMLLVDGLAMVEERLSYGLQGLLGQVPLFGGSAGDGLDFGATQVLHGGALHGDAAVITLVSTERPFRLVRTQHFEPTARKCVVTAARPETRVVTEIDGRPAAVAYAGLLGVRIEDLTPDVFARNPLLVRMGGQWYVWSVQQVLPDRSLRIYCAIDEGLVLTLGRGERMAENLAAALDGVAQQIGAPQLVVGCDCILRRLEAEATGIAPALAEVFRRHQVVGFNTYGEQSGAVHVNQTFTGVAIG